MNKLVKTPFLLVSNIYFLCLDLLRGGLAKEDRDGCTHFSHNTTIP